LKIAINGTSGFVGSNLCEFLASKGHEILKIKREIYTDISALTEILQECDALINLAGANISQRWSQSYKNELFNSRIASTKNLVLALSKTSKKPKIFISTSAVGIYESGLIHDESSQNFNKGFLGKLAVAWENEALKASELGVKTAIFRLGVVLGRGVDGKTGGALAKMLPIFKLGLGGVLAGGKQSFSWVHLDDLLKAYELVLNREISGIFNLVSPEFATNESFTKALANTLKRPAIFNVPSFVLQLKFGEGSAILLEGADVRPVNLLKQGFEFKFGDLNAALSEILS